ncbi:hypothetical protein [uncultured Desulfobacter sp.]|uniref:hypothetical protein n=1 Tax=uncultured Desulfobacter sp. TaxID=240139 RepID=UPI002AAA8EE2|nr:hypothetical protein [uncultured Desulfobacter sp.]
MKIVIPAFHNNKQSNPWATDSLFLKLIEKAVGMVRSSCAHELVIVTNIVHLENAFHGCSVCLIEDIDYDSNNIMMSGLQSSLNHFSRNEKLLVINPTNIYLSKGYIKLVLQEFYHQQQTLAFSFSEVRNHPIQLVKPVSIMDVGLIFIFDQKAAQSQENYVVSKPFPLEWRRLDLVKINEEVFKWNIEQDIVVKSETKSNKESDDILLKKDNDGFARLLISKKHPLIRLGTEVEERTELTFHGFSFGKESLYQLGVFKGEQSVYVKQFSKEIKNATLAVTVFNKEQGTCSESNISVLGDNLSRTDLNLRGDFLFYSILQDKIIEDGNNYDLEEAFTPSPSLWKRPRYFSGLAMLDDGTQCTGRQQFPSLLAPDFNIVMGTTERLSNWRELIQAHQFTGFILSEKEGDADNSVANIDFMTAALPLDGCDEHFQIKDNKAKFECGNVFIKESGKSRKNNLFLLNIILSIITYIEIKLDTEQNLISLDHIKKAVIRIEEEVIGPYLENAVHYLNKGDIGTAITFYEKMISISPFTPIVNEEMRSLAKTARIKNGFLQISQFKKEIPIIDIPIHFILMTGLFLKGKTGFANQPLDGSKLEFNKIKPFSLLMQSLKMMPELAGKMKKNDACFERLNNYQMSVLSEKINELSGSTVFDKQNTSSTNSLHDLLQVIKNNIKTGDYPGATNCLARALTKKAKIACGFEVNNIEDYHKLIAENNNFLFQEEAVNSLIEDLCQADDCSLGGINEFKEKFDLFVQIPNIASYEKWSLYWEKIKEKLKYSEFHLKSILPVLWEARRYEEGYWCIQCIEKLKIYDGAFLGAKFHFSYWLGDFKVALSTLRLLPEDKRNKEMQALLLLNLGCFDECIDFCFKEIKEDNEDEFIKSILSIVLFCNGKLEESKMHFSEVHVTLHNPVSCLAKMMIDSKITNNYDLNVGNILGANLPRVICLAPSIIIYYWAGLLKQHKMDLIEDTYRQFLFHPINYVLNQKIRQELIASYLSSKGDETSLDPREIVKYIMRTTTHTVLLPKEFSVFH